MKVILWFVSTKINCQFSIFTAIHLLQFPLQIISLSVLSNLKTKNNTIALVKGKSFYQKLEMFIIY